MDNKVVCYYCGTIYSKERGKCPLCGSSARSEEPADLPVPRRRMTEQERKERRRVAARGKYSAKKAPGSAKGLHTAALIFLALSVLVLAYFIGDMNGWWPGAEDLIERDLSSQTEEIDTSCAELKLSDSELEFAGAGETAELKVTVNASCEQTLYCNSDDSGVVVINEQAVTENDAQTKSATFTLTAKGVGTAQITVTCGKLTQTCAVTVGENGTADATDATETEELSNDFTPQLNCGDNISLFGKGEKTVLRVENLPDGYSVNWSSADVTVAKISKAGEVTAIGSGRTTLTAEVGGKTTEVLVRCTFDGDDLGAHLETEDVTLQVGDTFYLYLYDSLGEHITDITYTVSAAGVCKAENGVVTALASGTSTVTVTYYDQTFECIVRVR